RARLRALRRDLRKRRRTAQGQALRSGRSGTSRVARRRVRTGRVQSRFAGTVPGILVQRCAHAGDETAVRKRRSRRVARLRSAGPGRIAWGKSRNRPHRRGRETSTRRGIAREEMGKEGDGKTGTATIFLSRARAKYAVI